MKTNIELKEVNKRARVVVVGDSDFANVLGECTFFADESDAKQYAMLEGGKVLDEDGLAAKYETMHKAEGRQPNQSSHGHFIESQGDDDWDAIWNQEYRNRAEESFAHATVYAIDE